MEYDLQIPDLIKEIKEKQYKRVLIQLPDGLKPKAEKIVQEIEKYGVEVLVYFGTCFGGCDLPLNLNFMKIDLIVQFGHNKFLKESW